MPIGYLFWLLMILWLANGFWWNRENYGVWIGGNWVLFVLLFLLGWHDFGFILQGR